MGFSPICPWCYVPLGGHHPLVGYRRWVPSPRARLPMKGVHRTYHLHAGDQALVNDREPETAGKETEEEMEPR